MACLEDHAVPENPFDPGLDRYLGRHGQNEPTAPLVAVNGEEGSPGYAFVEDLKTGLWRDESTGYVWWVSNGIRVYRMDEGGGGDGLTAAYLGGAL